MGRRLFVSASRVMAVDGKAGADRFRFRKENMNEKVFGNLQRADPLCEFVVRMFAISRDRVASVQGSGLMLGAGLCITARHVLDDFLDRFGYAVKGELSISPLFDLFVIQIRPEDEAVLICQ